ncbi:DNA-binding HxlR family transcriptional regulator [Pseudomonas sp. TE3786]
MTESSTEATTGIETISRLLEGKWKLIILFHLLDGDSYRFSYLEKRIPNISKKMLIQQLRQLEMDGLVIRKLYAQVPPKVEYKLSDWG